MDFNNCNVCRLMLLLLFWGFFSLDFCLIFVYFDRYTFYQEKHFCFLYFLFILLQFVHVYYLCSVFIIGKTLENPADLSVIGTTASEVLISEHLLPPVCGIPPAGLLFPNLLLSESLRRCFKIQVLGFNDSEFLGLVTCYLCS